MMSAQQAERPPLYQLETKASKPSLKPPTNNAYIFKQFPPSVEQHEATKGPKLAPIQFPQAPTALPGPQSVPNRTSSAMDIDKRPRRRDTSASLEDADDRMAAEALCGLGKVGISRPSSGFETPLHYCPLEVDQRRAGVTKEDTEPLLSLLTSSHPWLGGTINGSLSAYSSTKHYSPRFVQNSAEFVERNIGTPVVNTVGAVGRRTGVEGSLRKYLGARRPSEIERIEANHDVVHKKRRMSRDSDSMEVDHGHQHYMDDLRIVASHGSADTLPVYDENRSPAYSETMDGSGADGRVRSQRLLSNRSWSTQLMITTSGLGAALSESSLRSLKYCLGMLRDANTHVRNLMEVLKKLLQEYHQSPQRSLEEEEGAIGSEKSPDTMEVDSTRPRDCRTIALNIKKLNEEIWQTFKTVVSTVSKYTGGALPENASMIVKWQLLSVPRRWQRAGSTLAQSSSDEAVSSANRMLAFAIEGLDMMEQVGGVVDSTIVSAEKWLETMGKKKQEGIGLPTQEKEAIDAPQ